MLATFRWASVLVGRRAALLGAAMLAASVVLVTEVHIAKTDAALLAAWRRHGGARARPICGPATFGRQAALFWLADGRVVLLKGPIGPMVAAAGRITLAICRPRGDGCARCGRPGACR